MMKKSPLDAMIAFVHMRIEVFEQTADQVFKRKPGDRSLTGPFPVKEEAQSDWQFALLSVAAYGRSKPQRRPIPAGASVMTTMKHIWQHRKIITPPDPSPDADNLLKNAGWTRWSDFPDQTLADEMEKSHLRAEVWENERASLIAVAFGGTVFTSGKDWKSNLRWFIPNHKDEYTEIVQRFGPDFVKSLALRMERPDTAYLKGATICSTGHSLGGGLAQQFAYSMPADPRVPRVSQVYAFDPSPVTGYFSVDPMVRDRNKIGLQIGRIYERGEILAVLRSFTSLIVKPSSVNAEISGTRFSLFYYPGPGSQHSIDELAGKMRDAAREERKEVATVAPVAG